MNPLAINYENTRNQDHKTDHRVRNAGQLLPTGSYTILAHIL